MNCTDVTIVRIKVEDSDRSSEVASAPVIMAVETGSQRSAVAEVVVVDSETDETAADLGPGEGTSKFTFY